MKSHWKFCSSENAADRGQIVVLILVRKTKMEKSLCFKNAMFILISAAEIGLTADSMQHSKVLQTVKSASSETCKYPEITQ